MLTDAPVITKASADCIPLMFGPVGIRARARSVPPGAIFLRDC